MEIHAGTFLHIDKDAYDNSMFIDNKVQNAKFAVL